MDANKGRRETLNRRWTQIYADNGRKLIKTGVERHSVCWQRVEIWNIRRYTDYADFAFRLGHVTFDKRMFWLGNVLRSPRTDPKPTTKSA
jgi:hypothetical protein